MKLSDRLQSLADLVPAGARVGDIGTDHGQLPCYLIQAGISPQVIAADVNALPLKGAQQLVEALGLEGAIKTRLGDGLSVLHPKEVDVVTISGMGGALMVSILEAAPLVVESLSRLILQPNVGAESLRAWGEMRGWHIVAEELILEDGRFYEVIAFEPGQGPPLTEMERLLGPMLLSQQHPLLVAYLREIKEADGYILSNLALSQSAEAKAKAEALENKWQGIKETIKCQFNVIL